MFAQNKDIKPPRARSTMIPVMTILRKSSHGQGFFKRFHIQANENEQIVVPLDGSGLSPAPYLLSQGQSRQLSHWDSL